MERKWGKRFWAALLMAGFIISLASVSWAFGRGQYSSKESPLREGRTRWERGFDCDLTLEQRTEFAKLKLSLQEETLDMRNQLMKKIIEMHKLWLEDAPDKTKIYALTDDIASIKGEMNKKSVDFLFEARKILTPEQLQKFSLPMQRLGGKIGHIPRLW